MQKPMQAHVMSPFVTPLWRVVDDPWFALTTASFGAAVEYLIGVPVRWLTLVYVLLALCDWVLRWRIADQTGDDCDIRAANGMTGKAVQLVVLGCVYLAAKALPELMLGVTAMGTFYVLMEGRSVNRNFKELTGKSIPLFGDMLDAIERALVPASRSK